MRRWPNLKRKPAARPRLLVEELERRILYSADASALLGLSGALQGAEVRLLAPLAPAPASTAATAAASATVQQTPDHEVIFIDGRVPDAMQLARQLMQQSSGNRTFDVVVLQANEDGVTQIDNVLANAHGLSAIHIISHGSDGEIEIGSTLLDSAQLAVDAKSVALWGRALAPGGDLLLYGCDVAQDAAGQAYVKSLARLTGADVAASSDLTGQGSLGANWKLEYTTGAIAAPLAIDAGMQQAWVGTLAITQGNVSSASTAGATSLTFAHTVAAGSNRLLLVEVDAQKAGATSVTYGGVALTELTSVADSKPYTNTGLWYLVGPTAGTANVVITTTTSVTITAGATEFYGVNQAAPLGTPVTAAAIQGGGTVTPSLTVASAAGQLVIATATVDTGTTYTTGGGQTELWQLIGGAGGGAVWGAADTAPGAASVTMSWTVSGSNKGAWTAVGVAIMPAAAANQPPTLTATALNPTYTEAPGLGTQAAAASVFGSAAASTIEAGQSFTGLTFTVAGLLDGANEVIVVDGKSIALGGNSAGTTTTNSLAYASTISGGSATIVLSGGTLTPAAMQTLVNGITYQDTSTDNPSAGGRVFTLTQIKDSGGVANGGSDTTALAIASTVTVVAVNDAPTLTATALNPAFTEAAGLGTQAAAVSVFGAAAASTIESAQSLTGLTFTVSGLLDGANEVIVVDGKSIALGGNSAGTTTTNSLAYASTISGASATIVLSGGTLTPAAMQTLVNGITYQDTSTDNPSAGGRVFTLTQVKDNGGVANGGSDTIALAIASTVTVVAVNDAPTLSATALNPTFTEAAGLGTQAAAVSVFGSAAASTIESGQSLTGLTLTVGGLLDGANEVIVVDGKSIALGANSAGTTTTNSLAYASTVSGGTATIVLSGGALTPAALQTLVNGITYQDASTDNPSAGNRVVTLTQIKDSGGSANGGSDTTALAIASTVTVVAVNDAPTLSATALNPTFTQASHFGTQAAAVAVFAGAAASTIEAGQSLTGLTFTVAGLLDGVNEVIVVDGKSITLGANSAGTTTTNALAYASTISGASATIVLSGGTLTPAAMQALVNGITYQDTNTNNPRSGNRVFTLTQIKDSGGSANGGSDTKTISIASTVNVVPVITTDSTSSSMTTGASSLTFSHTVGSGANGILIVDMGWQASSGAVSSVTYGGVALTFLGFSQNAGGAHERTEMWYLLAPATGTANVVVSMSSNMKLTAGATNFYGVNQANPLGTLVAATGGSHSPSVTVVSAPGELVIDSIADPSGSTGTVNGSQSELYSVNTGTAGGDTFGGSSTEAGAASVTMSWTISGTGAGAWAAVAVALKPAVNSPLVLTTTGTTLAYVENQAATAVDPALTVTDASSPTLAGATVQISANYASGQDLLTFTNTASITGSWNAVSGTLTLTGSDTLANYQAALQSVRYVNSSEDPSGLTRTVSFTASDGTLSSGAATRNISVTPVNDAPTLSATALNPTFTEAPGLGTQAAAVSVFGSAAASTIESGQSFTGLTFSVSGLLDGASEVIVVDGKSITLGANSAGTTTTNSLAYASTVSGGTATIVLSGGTLTPAAMQTLVNGITYQDTSTDNPSGGNRVVTLTQIKDSGGSANGGSDTTALAIASTVTVVAVNDAPTLTATALNPTFTEAAGLGTQAGAVSLFSGAAASTIEAGQTLTGLTFTVGGLLDGASEVIVVDGKSITLGANSAGTTTTNSLAYASTVSGGTATIVLSGGTLTPAAMQTLVNGITYQDTSTDNPSAGGRVFTLTQIKDSGGSANGGSDTTALAIASTVTVVAVNDAPTLSATALNPTFTEAAGLGTQAGAVSLFSGAAASTIEAGQTLTGLTFTVGGLLDGANEVIVVDGKSIALGGNSAGTTTTNSLAYASTISGGSATIVLSGGTLTPAAMQTLVNGITYQDTSTDNPSAGGRVFTLTQIKDSGGSANGGSDTTALAIASTVTVVAVNDAPTLSATALNPTFTEAAGLGTQAGAVSLFSGAAASTIEAGQTLTGLTFTVGGLLDGASEVIVVDGKSITLGANSAGTTTTNSLAYASTVSGGTATIVLSGGTLTPAAMQTLVNGITYQDTSTDNPSAGGRVFTLTQIKDSGGSANGGSDTTALAIASTVTVVAVNDAPTLSATALNPTFTEAAGLGTQAGAVSLFSGAAASTIEAGQTLTGLTFTVGGLLDGASEVIVVDGKSITLGANSAGTTTTNSLAYASTVSGGTATIVLSGGTLTPAAMQTLVNGITYQDASTDNPSAGGRVFTLTQIKDSGGSANGGSDTTALAIASTVTVVAVNDAPTLSATALNPTFTEAAGLGTQAGAVSLFSGAAASTIEAGQTLTGLTFTVGGLLDGASEVIVVDGKSITLGANSAGTTTTNSLTYASTVSGGTATIVLSGGTLTPAAMQTLVNGITYQDASTDNPSAGGRVFTLTQIKDSGGSANGGSDTTALAIASTVTVVAVNDAPTLSATALNPTFTEAAGLGTQAGAVSLFSGAAASTIEAGQTLTGLTFTVGGLLDGASEVIVVDGKSITLGANSAGTTTTNSLAYASTVSGGTATIVLSGGTLTPAAMQTLVNGITYQDTSTDNPSAGGRVFTLTQIKDSGGSANGGSDTTALAIASTVTVVAVNDAPTLSATALNPTFTEAAGLGTQAGAVSLFSGAAASTIEAGQTLTGLTFTVGGLLDGASEVIVVDGKSITLGANSAGTTTTNSLAYASTVSGGTATIVLSGGTLTPAAMQTLVNGITYQDTSTDNPSAGGRVFTLTQIKDSGGSANGGSDTTALAIASTVTVVAVNDAPTLSATALNPTFTEAAGLGTQAGAVSLFSGAAASTIEAGQTLTGLTFTVGGLLDGANEVIVVDGKSIALGGNSAGTTTTNSLAYASTISGGSATIVLSGGTLTPAAMQTLVNGITYQDTSTDNPSAGGRVFTLTQIKDSGGSANGGSDTTALAIASTVTVVAVNDAPTLSATALNPTFTEAAGLGTQAGAVSLFSGAAASTIEAGQTLTGLTFTVGGLLDGASEVIVVDGKSITLGANSAGTTTTNSLTYASTVSGGTATIVLSGGTLTPAAMQTLVNGITYQDTSTDNPSAGGRVFTLTQIKDSGGSASGGSDTTALAIASTVTVVAVNDPPTATNLNAAETYTQNTSLHLTPIVVSDVDSPSVTATLTLSSAAAGGLNTASSGSVTSAYDSGAGVWSASGAIADVNTLLAGLTFAPALGFSSNFTIATSVSDGVAAPITGVKAMTGVATVNPPVVTTSGGALAYTENQAATPIDAGLTVTDAYSPTLASATVQISANYANGQDMLAFTNTASIAGSWDAVTGTLTLTGSDTVANYQAALRSVTYFNSSDAPSTALRSVAFAVDDGSASSATAGRGIAVTAVNDAPVLSGSNPLAAIGQDPGLNPGTLVSTLLAGHVSDPDGNVPAGIAVTAVDNGHGSWQYSTDHGTTWTAFVAPSDASARLLAADADTYVRFVPAAGWSGTVASGITLRAWDQTAGAAGGTANVIPNGGGTAFSAATAAAGITVNPTGTVSGTVYEDIGGVGSLAGAVGSANVTVRLYLDNGDGAPNAADSLVATALTDGTGKYSFTGLANATYWVTVDSKTITPSAGFNPGFGAGDVWAEQTYGAAGSVLYNASYTFTSAAGALFGGMQGAVSDNAATLATAEHVTRVVTSGNAVGGVDSAFSFNVVTNTLGGGTQNDGGSANRTVEGSLRQFIENADAIAGANAMRFVPAVATNASGNGGSWWSIDVTNALPAISDAATTIDGTAYSAADGVTVVNPNAAQLGAGGTVGTDGIALAQVNAPELEIVGDRTVPANQVVPAGLELDAGGAVVRGISIYGFGKGLYNNNYADIVVRSAASGAMIEDNVIGAGASSFSDPGAASRTDGADILFDHATGGTVSGNLIGFAAGQGIWGWGDASGLTITGNEIRSNVQGPWYFVSGIELDAASNQNIVGNLITGQNGSGINLNGIASSDVISDNTVVNNGIGVPANYTAGIRLGGGGGGLIERNVIDANAGDGVLVTSGVSGVTISRNSIYGNGAISGGIGIDLLSASDSQARGTAPYVTLNDPGDGDAGGNDLKNFPVLASATVVSPTQIAISGSYDSLAAVRTYRIEFFASASADASGYGQGQRYLGFADVTTDAAGNGTFTVVLNAAVTAGEVVSATATDLTLHDTSEFARCVVAKNPNHAPSGTPKTVTTNENAAYTFGIGDFGYADPGDSPPNHLQAVKISSLPGAGALTDNGLAVVAGQFVAAADIAAGLLVFTPAANAAGAGYAGFTFQVQDDGGTAGGGVDLDPTPRTLTIDVVAVNVAPTLTATPLNPTFTEAAGLGTQAGAVSLFSGAAASTIEAGQTLTGLTFTVGGLLDGASELIVVDGKSITLGANSAGTTTTNSLTYASTVSGGTATIVLSGGTLTPAAMQTLVNGITYQDTSTDNPSAGGRVFTLTQIKDSGGSANGGSDTTALAIASTVTVVAVNDAPVLSATALNPTFTEAAGLGTQAAAVSVFGSAAASTIESGQSFTGLTFTVAGLLDGANEVIVVDGKSIALGANSAGTTTTNSLAYTSTISGGSAAIVLSGGALTPAAMQTLVDGITYQNTGTDNPSAGNRVVTLTQVKDSGGSANGGSDTTALAIASTVTVVAVNDAPTLSATALNPTFTEAAGLGTQAGAVSVFGSAAASTIESPQSLTGLTFTVAGLLDGANEVVVVDGQSITLGANSAGTTTTNSLTYASTVSGGTATIVLSGGTLTPAAMQTLVNGITYQDTSTDNPSAGGRVFTLTQIKDSGGSANGGSDTTALAIASTVTVVAVNDAPTLSATALNPTFTEAAGLGTQAGAVSLFSGAAASTIEAGQTLTGLTFTVGGLLDGASEVIVVDGKSITLGANSAGTTTTNSLAYASTVSGASATIVLSGGTLTPAAMQTLVDGITYQNTNTDNPSAGARVVTFTQIKDSGGSANGGSDTTALAIASTVTVVAVNDAPTLAAWYSSSWLYRQPITIDHNQVVGGASLTDFAVLIDLGADANLAAGAQASGNDILFTSGDGTSKLDSEIETFTSASGALMAWVKVPNLSASVDTTLYMYFGNATAANQQNAAGVWDTNTAAVYHFGQNTGPYLDSTGNANTGAAATSPAATTGEIGGAQSFDGSSTAIVAPNSANLDPGLNVTVSAWVKINALGQADIVEKGGAGGYALWLNGDVMWFGTQASPDWAEGTTKLSTGVWYDIVGVSNNGTKSIYLNGVLDATAATSGAFTNHGALQIGNGVDGHFNGVIDEVRIDDTARSAAWIATEYRNQNSSGALATVGAVQTALATAPSSGTTVGTILNWNSWADADIGASRGIAVTSQAGDGIWQYSTDGSTWTDFGVVSSSSALLLDASTQVRFAPTSPNGQTATFDFRAWDETSGSASAFAAPAYADPGAGGGSSAFSLQSGTDFITVFEVNHPPVLTATSMNPFFAEAPGLGTQAAAVSVFGSAAASTIEAGQSFTGLTFTVAGLLDGADEVIVVDGKSITLGANSAGTTATNSLAYASTVSGASATIVLSGGALTPAAMQTLVDGITYQNTSTDNPSAGARVFTLTQVKDSGGVANGGSDTTALAIASTVTVVAVNDAPTLSATALNPTFTEAAGLGTQAAAVSVFGSAVASTIESAQSLTGLTFTVAGLLDGANEVVVVDGQSINLGANSAGTTATNSLAYASTVSGASATIVLSGGTLAPAAMQTLVDGITYQDTNTDNPSAGGRVFTLTQIKDNGGVANGGSDTTALAIASTVTVVPLNDPPTLTATPLNPTFTEAAGLGTQAGAVSLFSGAAASTIEAGQSLTGLTFTVGGLLDGASEVIVVDGKSIALGGNSAGTTTTNSLAYASTVSGGTATIVLSGGTLTPAAIQTLVNGITYQNTNTDNPSAGNRVVTLTQIKDSGGSANGGSDTTALAIASTVTVVAVNDAPTLSATALNPTFTEAAGLGTQAAAVSVFGSAAASTIEAGQSLTGLTFTVAGLLDGASEVIVVDGQSINLGANSAGTTTTNSLTYTSTISGGTATIVLSGGALTPAAMQTLVDGITYQNTNTDNPSAGNRVVTLTQVKDSGGSGNGGSDTTALAIASTVAVVAVNDAPVLAAVEGTPLTYTENAPATPVTSSLTVADVDNATLAGATIKISANYAAGQDVLAFANTASITGTWDAATGTLTLSGDDTLVNYETALRSITYFNSSDNPNTLERTVSFIVNDGSANSASLTRGIAVSAVNNAPTLSATALNPTFTEAAGLGTQAAAVSVFGSAAASTIESAQSLTGLTFTVAGLLDGANEVIVVDGQSINLGANSAGTTATNSLSFSSTVSGASATIVLSGGTLTPAAMQTLVDGITYQNTSTDNPSAGNRVVTLTQVKDSGGSANGGSDTTSLAIASTVTVVAVNDAPVLSATALNPTFTEAAGLGTQAAAVSVFGSTAASTIESAQSLTGLTFTVAGLLDGANEVVVVDGQSITLGANSAGTTATNSLAYASTISGASATIVLSGGTLTPAAMQTLVDGITYQNTSTDNPSAGNRVFTLTQIKDSGGVANGGSDTTSLAIASTVTVVAVNDAPVLSATALNPTFTEAAGLGTQAAAVSVFGSTAASTIESAQSLTGLTFTVAGLLDGANEVVVVDGQSITLGANSAGTTATNSLSFSSTVSGASATIVLSGGTLTPAAMQTLVDGITYQNTSTDNPSAGNRVVTLTQVKDSGGSANGGSDTTALAIASTVTVVAVNDAPTLSATALNPTFTEAAGLGTQAGAVSVFGSAAASTIESPQSLTGLTFTVAGLLDGASEVIVVDGQSITLGANSAGTTATNSLSFSSTVSGASATIVLSGGTLTPAAMQTLVDGITYQNTNTDNPSAGNRVLTLTQIKDSGGVANGGSDTTTLSIASTVTVVAVNDAPVLAAIEGSPLAYSENAPATPITGSLTVADADNAKLAGATVQITGNYAAAQDLLAFANTATITASWDGTTGTLTLSGADTLANYQAALRSVTYFNSSNNPSTLARTVAFTVSDGGASSAPVTRDIAVSAVNNAPTLSATALNPVFTEAAGLGTQAAAVSVFGSAAASTIESAQSLTGLTFTVAGLLDGASEVIVVDGQSINLGANSAGTTTTNSLSFSSTVSGASATIVLSGGTLTPAAMQTLVDGITYQNTNTDNPSAGNRVVTLTQVKDSGGSGNGGSDTTALAIASTVTVVAVNDAPTTAPVTLTAINENGGARLITQAELLGKATDVDGPALRAAGLSLASGSGRLVANGDGTWTFTPSFNESGTATFAYAITDGSASTAATARLEVTAVPLASLPIMAIDSIAPPAVPTIATTASPAAPPATAPSTAPDTGHDGAPDAATTTTPGAGGGIAEIVFGAAADGTSNAGASAARARTRTAATALGLANPQASYAQALPAAQHTLSLQQDTRLPRELRAQSAFDLDLGAAASEYLLRVSFANPYVALPTASVNLHVGMMDQMSQAAKEAAENDAESAPLIVQVAEATGVALTVGTVWWALRAGGLLASLLGTLPAWRHVDLLAVLPDDEDDEEKDGFADSDAEGRRDELAVDDVLAPAPEGDEA